MADQPVPDSVRVDFACNDPDNGLFAGRVDAIQIHDRDPVLELEMPHDGPGRAFAVHDGGFRLAGKVFAHQGRKLWLGNWCWDALWMHVDEAARMLAWLHRRRLFVVSCGESVLFRAWKDTAPLPQLHLTHQLRLAGLHQGAVR